MQKCSTHHSRHTSNVEQDFRVTTTLDSWWPREYTCRSHICYKMPHSNQGNHRPPTWEENSFCSGYSSGQPWPKMHRTLRANPEPRSILLTETWQAGKMTLTSSRPRPSFPGNWWPFPPLLLLPGTLPHSNPAWWPLLRFLLRKGFSSLLSYPCTLFISFIAPIKVYEKMLLGYVNLEAVADWSGTQ